MPQLPSGRHVAIDVKPMDDLLDNWHEEACRLELIGIQRVEDMFPYVRILELVPGDPSSQENGSPQQPSPLPPGLNPRDTGRRLNGWPSQFDDWSAQDRSAFQVFVDERLIDHLGSTLAEAKGRQEKLTKAFFARIEAALLKGGVHPSQDPGWLDLPESTQLDEYDMIVALGQCLEALGNGSPDAPPRTRAVDRLDGFLAMACSKLDWLPERPDPLAITTHLAAVLRQEAGFSRLPPDRSSWWTTQTAIECRNLWNDATLEPFFMLHAPKAWGVVKTVNVMTTDAGG
jgi:hypothetical protein